MPFPARRWQKFEFRRASFDDPCCFTLHGARRGAPAVSVDAVGGCLTLRCVAGHGAAVFALQSVASASLLREIDTLSRQCAEQRTRFKDMRSEVQGERRKEKNLEKRKERSETLEQLTCKRDLEEEQLVFLQDTLAYAQDQLQGSLEDEALATAGIRL